MFKNWLLKESTIPQLYQSTVDAFPNTKKRQHATNEINISQIQFTPFLGMKTLLVKGMANNLKNEHKYNSLILFKNINYNSEKNRFEIQDSLEKKYFLEKIDREDSEVLLRCNCADFSWRFSFYDWTDSSLYGNKKKKYEASTDKEANPKKMPGMCKHVLRFLEVLEEKGLFIK